jgi:hypothetical protein
LMRTRHRSNIIYQIISYGTCFFSLLPDISH